MNIHDSGYKKLFSNHSFFRDLLVYFVEEEWVRQLDFERATILDKSFIADQYKETEADLIYRVPLLGTESAIYIYLLIEFQSTVDRFMVVRVGHYLHSIYLEYRDSGEGLQGLPAIFPLVLYNGQAAWTAPTALSELIEQVVDLGEYGVETRYFPVIINQIPLERLLAEANIVSALFLAESRHDIDHLIERLMALYEAGEHKAVSLLANWYRQMSVHNRVPPEAYGLLEQEFRSNEEVRSMIVETLRKEEERIRQASKAEGIAVGIAEGIAKGKAEGKAEQQRLLVRRMLAKGYALAVIADLLMLSEAEVQALIGDDSADGK